MEINDLLHAAVDSGASDILLAAGAPPMFRILGDLQPANLPALTPSVIERMCRQNLNETQQRRLAQEQNVVFSWAIPGLGRFRFNVHRQRNSYAAAIRYIKCEVSTIEALSFPPIVEELTCLDHGLVLVTGPSGCGKSTTLAAMLDCINRRDVKHIITLEDPIEFLHNHGRSLVEQREIGIDCPSVLAGLEHAVRQDADVILVGELRDQETIRAALRAAEDGKLVMGTSNASTAAGTLARMVNSFPVEQQASMRALLGDCLRAVVSQRLLRTSDGRGRVAAVEVLTANRNVRTSVREGTFHLLPTIAAKNRQVGMQTMEQAIQDLVSSGRATLDEPESPARELCPA